MHLNYYFLRKLSPALESRLRGKSLVVAFSQDKDEIVFGFSSEASDTSFYIKADLKSDFTSLCFPERFDRARRNSISLFTALYGKKVAAVRVFKNERAIGISFESEECLVFKLFGNRSNILSFDQEGVVRELFNNQLASDFSIRIHTLDRNLDQSYDAFLTHEANVEKLYPTLGKLVRAYLDPLLLDTRSVSEKWDVLRKLVEQLEYPIFYLTEYQFNTTLSLLPVGKVIGEFTDPIAALNAFYYRYISGSNLEKEKTQVVRWLQKRISQTENYLTSSYERLAVIDHSGTNEQFANILMANLHLIPQRAATVELFDFYNGRQVLIKLKPDLPAYRNAELYYRKAKNEKIEVEKLQENIEVRERDLNLLKNHVQEIAGIIHLRELRTYLKVHQVMPGGTDTQAPVELFKVENVLGYTVLIGRNAKNNDLLTRKYTHKDDLWLHARDVSGSHVIIKHQAGKKFPAPVIERAAQLAAWYSKRKNDSLCPVIVTPKKFVRKPKGAPEGAVIVEKEEVVMVVPCK